MKTYAEDLKTPVIVNHLTFLGTYQTKRIDSVEFGVTTDPRVLKTLGKDDPNREIMRLTGDNVYADGSPMGDIRGFSTYVYTDDIIEIVG